MLAIRDLHKAKREEMPLINWHIKHPTEPLFRLDSGFYMQVSDLLGWWYLRGFWWGNFVLVNFGTLAIEYWWLVWNI